jgi:hypothetical protein
LPARLLPCGHRFNVTSKFGRIVDPLADKFLVCGTFICFALIGEPRLFSLSDQAQSIVHWAVVGILVLRETYVTILRQWAEYRGINFAATRSGKLKMFLQVFAIGTVILKMAHVQAAPWGYWFTSIVYALMVGATMFFGHPCLTERDVNDKPKLVPCECFCAVQTNLPAGMLTVSDLTKTYIRYYWLLDCPIFTM